MDRFDDLQKKISDMHRRIVRILSESERLDPRVRELASKLAEEAMELSNEFQAARTEHTQAKKSLIQRAFEFMVRAIPVIGELSK